MLEFIPQYWIYVKLDKDPQSKKFQRPCTTKNARAELSALILCATSAA